MKKLRTIGRFTGTLCSLILSACNAIPEGWADVQPACKTKEQQMTIRVEGGAQPARNLKFYSFIDADTSKEHPIDLETFYGEARLTYAFGDLSDCVKDFGVAAELNGGTGFRDLIRFGPTYTTSLVDGNFTALKFFPIETSGNSGMQAGLYSLQKITDRVNASVTLEYNFDPKQLYGELESTVKVVDHLKILGQIRMQLPVEKPKDVDFSPVVGVRYDF